MVRQRGRWTGPGDLRVWCGLLGWRGRCGCGCDHVRVRGRVRDDGGRGRESAIEVVVLVRIVSLGFDQQAVQLLGRSPTSARHSRILLELLNPSCMDLP